MNGIIYNTEQEAIDLIATIDSNVSFLFNGITNTYTYYLKHNTEDKYAVIINLDDMLMIMAQYPDVLDNIGSDLVTSVVGLTDTDWLSDDSDLL